jgi:hypothetical protein
MRRTLISRSGGIEILRWGVALALLSILAFCPAYAASSTSADTPHEPAPPAAGPVDCTLAASPPMRILAPNAVAVFCVGAVSTSRIIPDGARKLEWNSPENGLQPVTSLITVAQPTTVGTQLQPNVLILFWKFDPETNLQPNRKYKFTLAYKDRSPNITPAPLVVPVDTTESITLAYDAGSKDFIVTSNIGFSLDGHTLATRVRTKGNDRIWQPCNIAFRSTSPIDRTYNFICTKIAAVSTDDQITLAALQSVLIEFVGRVDIQQNSLPGVPLIPLSSPYLDVLGGSPKFDAKARFARPSAPPAKDSALEYLNFNYAAGVGATPAWTADAKYSPSLMLIRGFTLAPLATANIGNGKIQGQTAADTIDLGLIARTIINPTVASNMYALSFGTTYETDRRFDRDNVLGTFDLQWLPLILNNTQQRQQLVEWYRYLKKDSGIVQSDISPYKYFGYDVDAHIGVEGGWNVIEHQVNASKGGAVDILPMFPIFRIVPQAHALFQLYRFSFDELLVGRYLTTSEKTIVETPTNSLYLLKLKSWKGVSTFNFTYSLDAQGNLGINVKYTDGFSPPNYKRVNSVQAGIVLKY